MDYDSSSFNKFLISKNETHFRCLNWSWEPHKNAYVVDVCHCLADIRNIQQYEDVHKNEIFRVFEENKRYLYFKVTLKNYALMSQTKFLNTVTYYVYSIMNIYFQEYNLLIKIIVLYIGLRPQFEICLKLMTIEIKCFPVYLISDMVSVFYILARQNETQKEM